MAPANAEASAAGEDGGIFGEGYSEISLTREQLEAIWQGNNLPWDGIGLENVTLDATAAFQDGELIQVYIEARTCFTLQLVPWPMRMPTGGLGPALEESFARGQQPGRGTPVVAVPPPDPDRREEVPPDRRPGPLRGGGARATVTASPPVSTAFPPRRKPRPLWSRWWGRV